MPVRNEENEMSLALEKILLPTTGRPEPPVAGEAGFRLDIAVVFTTLESTVEALRQAGALASRLRARITLVVPQVVPYPLPLTGPPVPLGFSQRRFRDIARESPVETRVCLYLCRDRLETVARALKPHSLVVVAGRKRWWPAPEKSLARKLRGAGHEVMFMETE